MRRYEGPIYRVAYRLTGNHEDAQDLVQDTLLEAFRSFHRFQKGTYFDRWVYRIMTHTHIDHLRSRPKVSIESLDAPVRTGDGEIAQREIADVSQDPARQLTEQMLDEPVQKALSTLPDEFRAVVILSDIEGMTYEEVSQALQCPIGTVRSRLHRGRMILKEKLKDYVRL